MRIKQYLLVLTLFLSLCLSPASVSAAPVISNPSPKNNSFVSGGLTTFYISITENNLNESAVYFHIISEDSLRRGHLWDSNLMSCADGPPNWVCSVSKSFAIVKDDTPEFFYFNASDNSGNYGWLGTPANPLRITVDVSVPKIAAVTENNTYVSPNKKIQMIIFDATSGVNESAVISLVDWLYGNMTWNSSWTPMVSEDSHWTANWSASGLPNNSTWDVYVNATDNVGNSNESKILTVLVDNELPNITIVNLTEGQVIRGTKQMKIIVKDDYSGTVASTVSFGVESPVLNLSMACTGSPHDYTCSKDFNTPSVSDGSHIVTFYAYDNAYNLGYKSLDIEVDNVIPSVSITSPSSGAHVRDGVYVNATVSNPKEWLTGLAGVHITLENSTYSEKWNMTCLNRSVNWICSYPLNTTALSDGIYTIKVNVTNTIGYMINSTTSITSDNTPPTLTISPSTDGVITVSGNFTPNAEFTDNFDLDCTSIWFEIPSYSSGKFLMKCSSYGKLCSDCKKTFDSSVLTVGTHYTVAFTAEDRAGNRDSKNKTIVVSKPGSGGTDIGGGGGGGAWCGDWRCTSTETCLTCPEDCGKCPNISTTANVTPEKRVTPGIIPQNLTIPEIVRIVTQQKYSPVILALAIIGVMLVWYFLGFWTRKAIAPGDHKNVDEIFKKEENKIELLHNHIAAALETTELDNLKESVKDAMASSDRIKKEPFLLEALDKSIKSVKDLSVRQKLAGFVGERIKEVHAGGISRKSFVEETSGLLSDALKAGDISSARQILNKAEQAYISLSGLAEKELKLWYGYMELLNSLTTRKEG